MNINERPLVSVIIPTYNHASYLGRALQSVVDQTYKNWEVIVIDNHSTDNTDELVASFSDLRITYLKVHNKGIIARSRNVGINNAKGAWIAFLDSDDWWTVEKLQVFFESICENVDLIYHDLEIVNHHSRFFSRKMIKSWQIKPPTLMNLLLGGNCIGNSSVVVRKSLLEQIGGLNESPEVIAAEDYNTWLRIAQLTDKFLYLPSRLGYYFIHEQGMSQKDMSIPARHAVDEFIPVLNASQRLRLEANFRYTTGRFNYLAGNYSDIKENLLFAMKHGCKMTMIKSAALLCMSIYK